jgi:hypothetical protein
MSQGDPLPVLLARARAALERDGDAGPEVAQALLTAGVALAADHLDRGVYCPPFSPGVEVSPTEVALVVCSMLDAADIDMPQLAMWQALGMTQPADPEMTKRRQ